MFSILSSTDNDAGAFLISDQYDHEYNIHRWFMLFIFPGMVLTYPVSFETQRLIITNMATNKKWVYNITGYVSLIDWLIH